MSADRAREAYTGEWLVLVATLPVDDIPARMRALRTIESLGAGVLRDGVYLLPARPAHREAFLKLADDIQRAGGAAHVLAARTLDTAEAVELAALFDRSPRYADLVKTVESLRVGFGVADPAAIAGVLAKQRRDFKAIAELDFFDSPLRHEAERVLAKAEAIVKRLLETEAAERTAAASAHAEFRRRTWATRAPVSADRIAAAWLVRRFIDPAADFVVLGPKDRPGEKALGFGFPGAVFAKPDGSGAFDALLVHFDLAGNAALARLAQLVRAIEGGGKHPDAARVDTLLKNVRRRARSDAAALAQGEKTFEALYEVYSARTDA